VNAQTEKRLVKGRAGTIEVDLDLPRDAPRGLALIAHPHPLFGGTMDNKVVQTLARAFLALGYKTARPNFRGVGQSSGVHDEGRGEVDDMLDVIDHFAPLAEGQRIVLAGFSFGAYVQTHVAKALTERSRAPFGVVLVGLSVSRVPPAPMPPDTLLIHGENDDTVPLAAVLDWARPLDLAVSVVPGTDHFFHHRLTLVKRLVLAWWLGIDAASEVAG
jgi:alpha/beta superfamily hydrolase